MLYILCSLLAIKYILCRQLVLIESVLKYVTCFMKITSNLTKCHIIWHSKNKITYVKNCHSLFSSCIELCKHCLIVSKLICSEISKLSFEQ